MYDPEVILEARLAQEFGLPPGEIPFYEKIDCDELELKYLTKLFKKIRNNVHNANNRRVDMREWSSNHYVLVTLNLDTPDRQLANAGYSMRVRFALDPRNPSNLIMRADMSIKTLMDENGDGEDVHFRQRRGEWEVAVETLKPDMKRMIEENARKNRPLPEFFTDGHLDENNLFVESIGLSLRNIYPSYEKFRRRGKTIVTSFQHTEDIANQFLTPHGDVATAEDSEAEVEFLGFYNLSENDATPEEYEKLMNKGLRLLDKVIVGTDPVKVQRNYLTKSVRARNGLISAYGDTLSGAFDKARMVAEAALFSLSQHVRAEDVNIGNILRHASILYTKAERLIAPEDTTFQPAKYMR